MRQTLFYIPHELFGIPVFGRGWALGAWLLFGVAFVVLLVRRRGWTAEVRGFLPLFLVVAFAFYALLPRLEVGPLQGPPIGLAIRGYGVFVLLGIIAGVGLSVWRARRAGVDPELIYSLALWLFVIAIASARLFYVIQYWPEFQGATLQETLAAIAKFTEGGLVVYGAVVGGMLALFLFSRRHGIPMLKLGDLIAPGMAIGLAFGRIGCLMNGCCYGGICEEGPLGITFPRYASAQLQTFSPPYGHQLVTGELYGFRLAKDGDGRPLVNWVQPDSAAAGSGLRAETEIGLLNKVQVRSVDEAREVLARGRSQVELVSTSGDVFSWTLPDRSLPVHPTQIYSALNAALICLVVWFAYPFRTRNGQVLALLFILYSITRFLMEWIRTDEVGQWGTAFTISQLVSMIVLACCVALLFYLQRRPAVRTAEATA